MTGVFLNKPLSEVLQSAFRGASDWSMTAKAYEEEIIRLQGEVAARDSQAEAAKEAGLMEKFMGWPPTMAQIERLLADQDYWRDTAQDLHTRLELVTKRAEDGLVEKSTRIEALQAEVNAYKNENSLMAALQGIDNHQRFLDQINTYRERLRLLGDRARKEFMLGQMEWLLDERSTEASGKMAKILFSWDDAATENAAFRDLLKRISEWDHMDTAADGAFWRREIAKALLVGCKHPRRQWDKDVLYCDDCGAKLRQMENE